MRLGWWAAGATMLAGLIAPQETFSPKPPQSMSIRESGVGRFVSDFSGRTVDGRTEALIGSARARNGYIIAMTSATCPLSRKYGPSLARLEAECAEAGVRLVFVNSSPEESLEEKTTHLKNLGVKAPYFDDSDHGIARMLGARLTTEVFVLDRNQTLVYRGALDDQYGLGYSLSAPRTSYVRDRLAKLAKGENPEWSATWAPGCILNVQPQTTAIKGATYASEVSRIIQRGCVPCHHKGGSAPFSLETYDQVRARASMIEYVVKSGIMPPWFADPAGQESVWKNDLSLPSDEKATLLEWIKSGAPEGDNSLLPSPLKFTSDWKIGAPDVIFEYPKPFEVPAEGVVEYQTATVPTGFKEDKWIQGIQVIPSAKEVVHHVLVFIRRPGETTGPDGEGIGGYFGIYVPGNDTLIYPEGMAKRVPAGSSLKFQIHYTTNGVKTTDHTKIGLKFAPRPPVHEVFSGAAVNLVFAIPPGADNHPVTSTFTAPRDIQLLSFLPHMHVRGKAARYELIRPSGASETLLNIPRFDFNWQLTYEYKNLFSVPKGGVIRYTAWYDNSENNPANPDPAKTVRWGEQTFEEMQLGYVEFIVPGLKPGEELFSKEDAALENYRKVFNQFDKNGDGVLSRDELPALMFSQLDLDKDGRVTLEEAVKVLGR